ncbi:MAG: DUF3298 domain-containing protein [Anaerolineaceae bacterium]
MNFSRRKPWFILLLGLTAGFSFGCHAFPSAVPRNTTAVPTVLQNEEAVPLPSETPTPAPMPTTEAVASMMLTTMIQDEIQPEPLIVLNRRIPKLIGPDIDPVNLFNLLAEELVEREAGRFKDDMRGWDYDPAMPTNMSSFLSGYSVYSANEKLISIRLEFSTYMAGAAHPYSYVRPINYDLSGGELVFLDGLFRPDAEYLPFLSDFCQKQLTEKLGIDLFMEGLTPTLENFRSWGLTPGGLWIEFDPYQVAPYAAGPQQVLIPFDKMKDLLAPDGPAGWFEEPEIQVEFRDVPPQWPTPLPTP